ncbi:hypothetical protein GCM10023113_04330 [Cellulomonas oligotrophica]|uniref:SagD family biosynthesis docking scaffold protein n=1 Tax=Cellulomonas oligotrophica TaxID=931536 RepID=A0ABQ4D9X3_9CELL|nr:SagD family biosynthesis docking scaffold protein [Cellulomonas oligotrophica]
MHVTGTPDDEAASAAGQVVVLLRPGAALVTTHDARQPGCPTCLLTRHRLATPRSVDIERAEERWVDLDPVVSEPADPDVLARTVVAAARTLIAQTAEQPTPTRTVVRVDARTLELASHRFLPDPLCATCGTLPDDSPESADLVLEHRTKPDPRSYRYEDPVSRLETLKRLYVDPFCGLLHSLQRDTQGGLAVAGALMKLRRHEWIEPGFGRSRSYEESEATAILEALERYGGVQPGGRRTTVRSSFAALGDDAVDPRLFGVHPASTYADPGNHYRDFDPHTPYWWVWAYSFAQQRPVLVLQEQAYYYVAHDEGPGPFLYEVSNGCALGSAMEEAIFHALLEVAERDAFLMAWYRRLALPRLRVDTARHHPVSAQLRAVERETGYQVRLHDQTTENGIPSVWAIARHPDPSVTDRPTQVCAAGAHPSLEKAALNALSEIGPFLNDFIGRFPTLAQDAERMVDDPGLVRTMADHSTYFGSPRMRHHLDFLDAGPSVSFAEAERDGQFTHASMADDVREMVDRFLAEGQDVIVVDQTTDEHRAAGLSCVKVLVTGSLTMTFGHHLRRIEGIERLGTVPARLGLASAWSPDEPVLPHPFP